MANRILIILASVITSIVLYSCANRVNLYDHTAALIELGNDFYYLGDGSESQILLNLKPGAKSKVGKTIIPPEVIKYNYDESFIIAQTLERVNSKELYKYWIVEKTKKNQELVNPLDSITFYKNIDSLLIKIKLKPRR
ncbi:MAG: hypothetical protein ABJA37_09875 [Ferruginibacter sp.]